MPNKILVQNSKILTKNSKIILQPIYNINLIQSGLTTSYKAGDFIVNGNYCQQWNDSSGNNNHAIQNNVNYQLKIFTNQIAGYPIISGFNDTNNQKASVLVTSSTFAAQTMFIVCKDYNAWFYGANTTNNGSFIQGTTLGFSDYLSNNHISKAFVNGLKYNITVGNYGAIIPYNTNYNVYCITSMHNMFQYDRILSRYNPPNIGYSTTSYIVEMCSYNRELTNEEIVYNSNALMQKFNLI